MFCLHVMAHVSLITDSELVYNQLSNLTIILQMSLTVYRKEMFPVLRLM